VARMCTRCHGADAHEPHGIGSLRGGDVERGSAGTDQEARTVIDSMVKNFVR